MKIIQPEDILKKIKMKFEESDKFILLTTILLSIVNNFYFLIGDGVAPDAISGVYFNIASDWEISLGRFGIEYINMFRNGLVAKFLIILISTIMIALSVMLIKRIFKIKSKILMFIITILIAVAPQFTETYMFIYCADAYLFAFLMSVVTVFFLSKTTISKNNYIFAIISTIITCSIYQAYLGMIIALIIVFIINKIIIEKNTTKVIKEFINYTLTILTGVISYYILLKVILYVNDLPLASYKGANSLGINTIKQLPYTIAQCYKDFYSFFFQESIINNFYWDRQKMYFIIFLLLLFGLALNLIKNNQRQQKQLFKIICILIMIIILPIGIGVMNIIAPGTRLNLVTAPGLIAVWILAIVVYQNLSKNNIDNIIKYGILIICVALTWSYVLSNTFTYIAREQTFDNYKLTTSDIYTKATNLSDYSTEMEWMFSDVIRYRVPNAERTNGFITYDNLTWNNYNGTRQNSAYFQKYLGIKINICSKDTYDKIKEQDIFKNMPVYPAKGSIKIIDNVVVVKTTKYTY